MTAWDDAIAAAVRAAAEHHMRVEHLHAQGRAVGLTIDATQEVIDAWLAWYRITPYAVSWQHIGAMVTRRACALDWRP